MMAKETVPAAGRRYSWESGTVRTRRSVRRTALSDVVARSARAASILRVFESIQYIMGNPVYKLPHVMYDRLWWSRRGESQASQAKAKQPRE